MATAKPVWAIQVLDPSDVVRYTLGVGQTDGANCYNIMAKKTLTQNVGTFSFMVPTKKNGSQYYYTDIVAHDKVKIWFGYDSIDVSSDTPQFVGRVYQITGPLSIQSGYVRVIKGRDLGEVLHRRLKGMKTWSASIPTIVTELATDLGLEGDGSKRDSTPADTIDFTVDIDHHETYFNLLQKLSDYWISAGTQCKKDFYIDVDGDLVWKARPLRTQNVESFTVGNNIKSYSVLQDLDSVRNKIYVYGANERMHPADGDDWTETLSKPNNQLDHTEGTWTVGGTISQDNATVKFGTYSVETTGGASTMTKFTLNNGYEINANLWPTFQSNVYFSNGAYSHVCIRFYDNDTEGVFRWFAAKAAAWTSINAPVGRTADDQWTPDTGGDTINWDDIKSIEWILTTAAGEDMWVDGPHFNSRRFYDLAEDSTSQTDYDVRELMYVDDELRSNSECESRGEALIYQLKDPPTRMDLEVQGNTNVLMGDQLSMTIPAEDISAESFDIVTVTHTFDIQGAFKTFASMLNSSSRRNLPPRTRDEILVQRFGEQKAINRGAYRVH